MMKRILSTILVVICVVMCTACGKDEPYIEPSITVDEMLETLSNEGYVMESNEETAIESDYVERNTKSIMYVDTDTNGFITSVRIECTDFSERKQDFQNIVWTKLLNDKTLVGELISDLRSEEYLQNGILSEIERGNLSLKYFTTEKLNIDETKKKHEITLTINE